MPDPIALTSAALLIEATVGYPDTLFRAIRHPVVWIGALIAGLDRRLNQPPTGRAAGCLALAVVLAAAGLPSLGLVALLHALLPAAVAFSLLAVVASSLFAQRSLAQHVGAVADALRLGLAPGRTAVAYIVGRDPDSLDAPAVARAAIESLAENFADGVVAPAVWGTLLGLPGIALYKAANTADSMIGHRTPRHVRFGWASARFDDMVNLPAARLAALWIIAAALIRHGPGAARRAATATWRDAPRHRSPNAGWPEAAMAGALGLRLAGPRSYAGVAVPDAWMGDGRADATPADITAALALYRLACALQIMTLAALALLLIARG